MPKIVINSCHGGFGISKAAFDRLNEARPGVYSFNNGWLDMKSRSDPALVAIVEEMGRSSFGGFAELKVVEVPDDIKWHIEEYDGREWVAEDHRTWS